MEVFTGGQDQGGQRTAVDIVDLLQQAQPAHLGQGEIGQEKVKRPGADLLQGIFGTLYGDRLVGQIGGMGQQPGRRMGLVLDDENLSGDLFREDHMSSIYLLLYILAIDPQTGVIAAIIIVEIIDE